MRNCRKDYRPVESAVIRREEKKREPSTLGGVRLSGKKEARFPSRVRGEKRLYA